MPLTFKLIHFVIMAWEYTLQSLHLRLVHLLSTFDYLRIEDSTKEREPCLPLWFCHVPIFLEHCIHFQFFAHALQTHHWHLINNSMYNHILRKKSHFAVTLLNFCRNPNILHLPWSKLHKMRLSQGKFRSPLDRIQPWISYRKPTCNTLINNK